MIQSIIYIGWFSNIIPRITIHRVILHISMVVKKRIF